MPKFLSHRRAGARAAAAAALLTIAPSAGAWTVDEGTIGEHPYALRVYGYALGDFRLGDDTEAPVETFSSETRRLRLGAGFVVKDLWRLYASGEFSDEPELRDLGIEWRGWPVRIELGRFQEPFGLGEAGSAFDTLLMERPSATSLGPDNAPGLMASARGERWGLSAGVFHGDMKGQLGGDRLEDSATLRGTWLPVRVKQGYWHVGAGASLRKSGDPFGLRLTGSPETALIIGLTPVSPLVVDEDRYRLWNLETALRFGPALLSAEYIGAHVDNGLEWDGWYVEAGWAITGERRGYSTRYGAIGNLYPRHPVTQGGLGAIEIAARAGETDFSDGGGDRGKSSAIGLNWYPVDLVRLSINGLHLERTDDLGEHRKGNFAQARVQLSF